MATVPGTRQNRSNKRKFMDAFGWLRGGLQPGDPAAAAQLRDMPMLTNEPDEPVRLGRLPQDDPDYEYL